MVTINGLSCHETGCPDAWRTEKRECRECGCDFIPDGLFVKTCVDCLSPPNEDEGHGNEALVDRHLNILNGDA